MGWHNIGSQLFAMTLGQMSWGQGLPWFCNNSFTQDLFPNINWGQVGDSVQFNYTPSTSDTRSSSTKTEAEKKLEKEEKEAKNKEQAFEKRQLTKKFDKLKPLLTEFQNTLNDEVREEFDLIEDIKKCTKSVTKENYEKMLEIYNANKTKINEAKEKAVKEKLTSDNNTEYTTNVTTLKTKIEAPDSTFGILDNNGDLKDDIDIMELLSTWNSNSTTKTSHVMKTIGAKYKATNDGTTKSQYEGLVNALHNKLKTAAENINEDKLSEETKKLLKDAQDNFEKFDIIEKRFPTSEEGCGKNYSNAFDNLYRAIRLAEAEIAEKELKESFDFLGDENPYKTSTIVTATKTDLKNEGLTNARTVTEPVAPSVPSGAKEIKVESTSYYILHTEDGTIKYYKADGTEMTKTEFENTVGEVTIEDGCYSIQKGDTTTYYKDDHTKIDEATFNALTETEEIKNEADANNVGSSIYSYLDGWTDSSKEKEINDLLGKITKNNALAVLDGFYASQSKANFIEWIREDCSTGEDANVKNATVKTALDNIVICFKENKFAKDDPDIKVLIAELEKTITKWAVDKYDYTEDYTLLEGRTIGNFTFDDSTDEYDEVIDACIKAIYDKIKVKQTK